MTTDHSHILPTSDQNIYQFSQTSRNKKQRNQGENTSPFPRYRLRHQKPATIPALPGSGSRSSKGSNDMTFNSDPSTFLDQEKEALWYLGGHRIINALGERIEGAFRLHEFVN